MMFSTCLLLVLRKTAVFGSFTSASRFAKLYSYFSELAYSFPWVFYINDHLVCR